MAHESGFHSFLKQYNIPLCGWTTFCLSIRQLMAMYFLAIVRSTVWTAVVLFVCFCCCFINLFILFIYFWLHWVFVAARRLSLVVASGGHSSSRCAGLSLLRPLLLWSTGSRRAGSVVVAHGPSCSAACGIFPDQGSNPRPLH